MTSYNPKRKYGAKRTTVDGISFHSKRESEVYSDLKWLENAGQIIHLELQPKWNIIINDIPICKVILDFRYFDKKTDKWINLDVKGFDTAISKLKRKMLEASHPLIKVTVVK